MKQKKIVELLEEIAPTGWFEDEDNSGIQIECGNKNISRVLVCLEINDEIIREAKRKKAEMIITHHPLLFYPIGNITSHTPVGRYVMECIRSGIGVYSSHLAFDTAKMGNNMYLASLLKLRDVAAPEEWEDEIDESDENDESDDQDAVKVTFGDGDPVISYVTGEDGFEYDVDDVGSIGYLPRPMGFKKFCSYVERSLDLPKHYIRCVDGGCEKIEKIAFCTGAGGDFINVAVRENCDAYITGDLKLHEAQYAKAMGLTVIDAGHYGTEKIFTENMAAQLREAAADEGLKLEVIEAVSDTDPYTVI